MTVCKYCGHPMTPLYNGRGSYLCMSCDYETIPFIETTQIPAPSIPAKPGTKSGSKRPE